MPTTLHKINVTIETSKGSFLSDHISIIQAVNDIPSAIVSYIPKNSEEKKFATEIENLLFEKFTIYESNEILFEGIYVGSSYTSSANGVSINFQLYGSIYNLVKISSMTMGISVVSPEQTNRFSIDGLFMKSVLAGVDITGNIISIFKSIMTTLYDNILSKLNDIYSRASAESTVPSLSRYGDAIISLSKLNSEGNKKILNDELSKLTAIGIENNPFRAYSDSYFTSTVAMVTSLPDASIWDILIRLCESYGIYIGCHRIKTYAFPVCPMGEPVELNIEDIASINVNPMPINVYTRCLFSTDILVSQNEGNISSIGSYPPLSKSGEATKFEKKLGCVRPLVYHAPYVNLHTKTFVPSEYKSLYNVHQVITGNPIMDTLFAKAREQVDNNAAQYYLMKEMFKDRSGSLTMRFSPDIPVGLVIKFTDPFFGIVYQGFISSITHSLSSTSVNTSVTLQYLMSEKEKELLGFEDFYKNPFYPEFKPRDLL